MSSVIKNRLMAEFDPYSPELSIDLQSLLSGFLAGRNASGIVIRGAEGSSFYSAGRSISLVPVDVGFVESCKFWCLFVCVIV